jgi:hypothetical protein
MKMRFFRCAAFGAELADRMADCGQEIVEDTM